MLILSTLQAKGKKGQWKGKQEESSKWNVVSEKWKEKD